MKVSFIHSYQSGGGGSESDLLTDLFSLSMDISLVIVILVIIWGSFLYCKYPMNGQLRVRLNLIC